MTNKKVSLSMNIRPTVKMLINPSLIEEIGTRRLSVGTAEVQRPVEMDITVGR